jgi:hypothetical protein
MGKNLSKEDAAELFDAVIDACIEACLQYMHANQPHKTEFNGAEIIGVVTAALVHHVKDTAEDSLEKKKFMDQFKDIINVQHKDDEHPQ